MNQKLGFYKKMNTRPCCICKKQLESASHDDGWDTLQPHEGGEIQLIFGFGSCKFDHFLEGTRFRGIICDKCAEKIIQNLYIENNSNYPANGDISRYFTELPKE